MYDRSSAFDYTAVGSYDEVGKPALVVSVGISFEEKQEQNRQCMLIELLWIFASHFGHK